MSYAIIIPAQEENRYHKNGDIAPFGHTTLLEWKIVQCKECSFEPEIYIASSSERVEQIAESEQIKFIPRDKQMGYSDMLKHCASYVSSSNIIFTNATSPFVNAALIDKLVGIYSEVHEEFESLNTVKEFYEYAFWGNKALNFLPEEFTSRNNIQPVRIATNGCSILKKDTLLNKGTLFGSKPYLYPVGRIEATEIKDICDYKMAIDLISRYIETTLEK